MPNISSAEGGPVASRAAIFQRKDIRPAGNRFGRCLPTIAGQRAKIEPQLTLGIDQAVPLAEQKLLAFDDYRKLRQRPLHAGHQPRQVGQLALQRLGRDARGQQLRQPPGRGDFLKIKIRQLPHLASRHDQAAPMPAANHRHAYAQQVGQHGGRVQPLDALLSFDQADPLPELGLGDDLELARLGPARCPSSKSLSTTPSAESNSLSPTTIRSTVASELSTTMPPCPLTSCWASRRGMPASLPTSATRLSVSGPCTIGSATVSPLPREPWRAV